MVKFINRLTGGEMWVSDERAEEYKAAGHRLAAGAPAQKTKPAPKPKARRKK